MSIRENDVANGPGVRVTLFVSGCKLNCKGCFNKEAQCFFSGQEFTDETIDHIIELCKRPHITGLTLLGGDPLEPDNQPMIRKLVEKFRETFVFSKDIWCWTGRTFPNELLEGGMSNTPHTLPILWNIDILVDGRFVEALHIKGLKYMGSTNQRIINVSQSLKENSVILSEFDKQERRGLKS